MSRFLLKNATIVTGEYSRKGSLAIDGERIFGIWFDDDSQAGIEDFADAEVIDLDGKVVMAGGIDAHVHFREPGMTHKADIESESKAALLGGITSFIDMPNTAPPTTSMEALENKLEMARGRAWANYGFHIGATNDNAEELRKYVDEGLGRKFGGIKVFMGSSTGNMLVDRYESLQKIFGIRTKEILVHSEDEWTIKTNLEKAKARFGDDIPFSEHPNIRSRKACIESTARALRMAIDSTTRLHVLHVTTKEEVDMIRFAKKDSPFITAETSANYLWFYDDDYRTLGSKVKCNPAIKTRDDRDALIIGLADGTIDTIGSDHAPHLISEKDGKYLKCPSGVPSIQQSMSVVLTIAHDCGIPLQRITNAFSENVARLFGIVDRGSLKVGNYADIVVVDPEEEFIVGKPAYKCGWSPYEGEELQGAVKMVFVNGILAVRDGEVVAGQCPGQELQFLPKI